MSFLAQSSHEDWLSDWRAGSKVSRKDVLWLMMNLVFFVREGTEEADLREGKVGGWFGMEEKVFPGQGCPQLYRPRGGTEVVARAMRAGGESQLGRPRGVCQSAFLQQENANSGFGPSCSEGPPGCERQESWS